VGFNILSSRSLMRLHYGSPEPSVYRNPMNRSRNPLMP
jgi:hypothetical protein